MDEEITTSHHYHRYQENDDAATKVFARSSNHPTNNQPLHIQDQQVKNSFPVVSTTTYQNSQTTLSCNHPDCHDRHDWMITDIGHSNGLYSRDGSIHVTDEVFNTGSHLVGTLLSILGTSLLVTEASTLGEPWKIVSFSIYGASLIFLFSCSTIHHGIIVNPYYETLFRMLDYLAIYPLIGGTFTPLCLVYYHDSSIGWVFFSTVWGIAMFGFIITALFFTRIPKWLSMTMYITLGWLGACMTYWLLPKLTWSGYSLFLLGGVLYTIGGYIYTTEKPNPYPGKFGFHEIWHIFVLLAAATHWLMMYLYVLRA